MIWPHNNSYLLLTAALFVLGAGILAYKSIETLDTSAWELRTAAPEAIGSGEIESGKLDSAIVRLVASYPSATDETAGPILSNLCLAYTLKEDYPTAMKFCELAIDQPNIGRDTYNNRGVLHALQGQYDASIKDFENAACTTNCPSNLNQSQQPPDGVLLRNLARARAQLAAMMDRN
jgi:tetratricopeptide (TPR) repeat protein